MVILWKFLDFTNALATQKWIEFCYLKVMSQGPLKRILYPVGPWLIQRSLVFTDSLSLIIDLSFLFQKSFQQRDKEDVIHDPRVNTRYKETNLWFGTLLLIGFYLGSRLTRAFDCVLARQDFRESRIIRKKIYDRTYAWILIWENTSVEPQDPKIQA